MESYKELLMAFIENPQGAIDEVVAVISNYKPLAYKLLNELFEIYKDLVNNEEFYAYTAKDRMNDYQALINAGFTEEQAFTLLLNNESRQNELIKRIQQSSKAKVDVKY